MKIDIQKDKKTFTLLSTFISFLLKAHHFTQENILTHNGMVLLNINLMQYVMNEKHKKFMLIFASKFQT